MVLGCIFRIDLLLRMFDIKTIWLGYQIWGTRLWFLSGSMAGISLMMVLASSVNTLRALWVLYFVLLEPLVAVVAVSTAEVAVSSAFVEGKSCNLKNEERSKSILQLCKEIF